MNTIDALRFFNLFSWSDVTITVCGIDKVVMFLLITYNATFHEANKSYLATYDDSGGTETNRLVFNY